MLFLPAAWCGAAGAIVSTAMWAPDPFKDGQLLPPEVAGMKLAFRTAWPLIVAIIGTLPVVAARRGLTSPATSRCRRPSRPAVAALLVAGVHRRLGAVPGAGAGHGGRASRKRASRRRKERQAAKRGTTR